MIAIIADMRKPSALLKGAITHFKTNPKLFLGVVSVPLIINLLMIVLEPSQNTGVVNMYEWVVYGALGLVLVVFDILMGVALILAVANPTLTIRQAYGQATGFFWRYLGFSIVLSLIILVGLLLFVIPAIIFLVWFTFSIFVLVLENGRIIESLKRSREYVRGHWWAVFGRMLFVIVITLIILAPLSMLGSGTSDQRDLFDGLVSLVTALITPFTIIYMYLMYQDIKGTPTV